MIVSLTSIISGGCTKKDRLSLNNKEKLKNIQLPKEKGNVLELDIYFDSSLDENKVEIGKEEVMIPKEEVLGELIINALIKGPSINSKLKAVIPKDTRLLSFCIKDNVAFVNLSKEAKVKMSAPKEEACLRSLISSLTQLSSISKIKILIENKDTDVLGGNFDISKPFGKDDIDLIRKK